MNNADKAAEGTWEYIMDCISTGKALLSSNIAKIIRDCAPPVSSEVVEAKLEELDKGDYDLNHHEFANGVEYAVEQIRQALAHAAALGEKEEEK
jgi:hypothetical protein